MSHSKYNKRGYSLYLEKWYPSAKRYIHTCTLCGRRGYSPAIEEKEFCATAKNRVIYRELTRILHRIDLDEWGRCRDCAGIQDRKTPAVKHKS